MSTVSEDQDPVLVSGTGPVRTLTLNRPHRRNALDLDDRRAFLDALHAAEADDSCRAIVLTGAGSFFCAGGDVRSMPQERELAKVRLHLVAEIARALVRSAKPVVCAVEGGATGAGLSLAAACDFVVAADDGRFVPSFGKIGLIADTGLFWSLAQRVGPGRAKELLLLGTELDAERALREGLISEVTPAGSALRRATDLAHTLATAARGATAGTKRIFAQERHDLDSVLDAETEVQLELLAGDDFAEGRNAFFERRAPQFAGRPGGSSL